MYGRGRSSHQWQGRQPTNSRQAFDGPSSQHSLPYLQVQQALDPTQANGNRQTNANTNAQYVQRYHAYLQNQVSLGFGGDGHFDVPSTATNTQPQQASFTGSAYQDSFGRTFSSGPVVHEGFIPAPGNENEDELGVPYPALPRGYRDSLFQVYDDGSDSEDERALEAEEERIMREIENKMDDSEIDADYSMDEAEELEEEDPDEMLLDEELDDDDEEEQPQRPRPGNKRGQGRGGRRARTAGVGRGGVRGASLSRGKRRGPKGKGKKGGRKAADPGPQFKALQRSANEAYLRGDYAIAVDHANQAIQLNPEIFAAHTLLSEIYAAMGEEQRAIEALIVGAPTKRDKDLWFHIIDRVDELDPEEYPMFTENSKTAVILDCLRQIIILDPLDYEARKMKLDIESTLGHVSRAVRLCRKMLTMRPDDSQVLKTMARLGTSSDKQTKLHLTRIIASFDTSIAYFLTNDDPSSSNLDWSLLNIYLDLLERSGDHVRGLVRLKSLSRWLQHRKAETYWDSLEDDREFDVEDTPRRITVSEFSRKSPRTRYGKTLPLEIRVKMGLFRLRHGPTHLQEAMHHFEELRPDDKGPSSYVPDYLDLFRDVADVLQDMGFSPEAKRFYDPLYSTSLDELELETMINMYNCYRNVNEQETAEELMDGFKKWGTDSLDELAILTKFFEMNEMKEEAFELGIMVYKNGGRHLLVKVDYDGLADVQDYFWHERKKARGKHGLRKSRVKSYMRALKAATREDEDSEREEGDNELPSLGPMTERPKLGLFRTKKYTTDCRPKAFLPEEISGTNVPYEAVDHAIFLEKLEQLAREFPEELKTARVQHREITASFKRLRELTEAAEDGEEDAVIEWISIGRELIEEFSTFDLFYYDRTKSFSGYFRRVASGEFWKESSLMVLAVAANNVDDGEARPEIKEKPDTPPTEFYGVHFDKWFDVFGQYCVLLANRGEHQRCFSTFQVAAQSNIIYRSPSYMYQLNICRLACALALDDSLQASIAIRHFMRTHPFNSSLCRLYGGVQRFFSVPDGFAASTTLKALTRYMKTIDYALLSTSDRDRFNFRGQEHGDVQLEIVDQVEDHDPALFTLLGHIHCSGGSYRTALNEYFRAFALTPDDPILSLSIGLAYIQHGMKRSSENRQFQVIQGLSFVYRYYEMRTKHHEAILNSEAEFNLGRVWHSLGLVTQSVTAYQRCMALSKQVQEEAKANGAGPDRDLEDFAKEAAYCLQQIYALSGNFERAMQVTQEALVIE